MTSDEASIIGAEPVAPRRLPVGKIESVADMVVVGWGVGGTDGPVALEVQAQALPVATVLSRRDRPDVRAAFRTTRDEPYGFAAELNANVWHLAGDSGEVALVVRLDGHPFTLPPITAQVLDAWWPRVAELAPSDARERQMLRFLAHVAAAGGPGRLGPAVAAAVEREAEARGLLAALRERDAEQQIPRAVRQRLRLERLDGIVVAGWASDPALEPQEFRVACNGAAIDALVERQERADVQEALDTVESEPGFRIELSPQMWALADAHGRCSIDLYIQGRSPAGGAWQVDAALVRGLVAGLMPEGGTAPHLSATALRDLCLLEQHAVALAEFGWFAEADMVAVGALMHALDPEGLRRAGALMRLVAGPAVPRARCPGQAVRAVLETWKDLVLTGWVVDETAGGEVFRLLCNGHEVAFNVTRTHRDDVRKALGIESVSEFPGFEILLPPRMWHHADAEGACTLTVLVNDRSLSFPPVRVDAAVLEAAVARRLGPRAARALRAADPGAVRDRALAWLLVEHVAASGGPERLGEQARTALQVGAALLDEARRHGLDPGTRHERGELLQRRRVWRLQRRFNALLGRSGASVQAALDTILADVDATGAVRTQLLLSLVPPLCDDAAAIERVEQELPLDVQAFHAARGDNWQRSLYLVGLARAGRFADACSVLERIVDAPTQGWLNTECIAYAVRHALQDPGAIEPVAADAGEEDGAAQLPRLRIVDLFLALLDSLPGAYWSRRHDLRLVDAMATIVASQGALEGPRAQRMRDTALHHYGLVPSFWARLDALGAPAHPVLARARDDFECLRATIAAFDAGRRTPEAWREASERLRIQCLLGRRGALQFLRELMLADLANARTEGRAEDVSWHFVWEAASPTDFRRLEAFPLPRADATTAAAERRSLWPTPDTPPATDAAAFGPENRLDLRSPPERVAALAAAQVLVVCVVRNERVMLPHFLAHYRRLGARHFVFVDNDSDDGTPQYLLAQPDVVLYATDTDYRDSHYGVSWQQAVLAAHGLGRWAIVADADELLLYPECETLPLDALVRRLDAAGHDAAQVLMLDMYPQGALRDTDFARAEPSVANWFDSEPLLHWRLGAGLYSNAPTWLSALRHRLIPHSPPNAFTAQKIALLRYRPWVRLSEGLHYAAGLATADKPLFFGHYKYHAGFREKVLLEIERKQHYDSASEYRHYLAMVAEPDASLFAPGISVHLADSRALPAIGGAAPPAPGGAGTGR